MTVGVGLGFISSAAIGTTFSGDLFAWVFFGGEARAFFGRVGGTAVGEVSVGWDKTTFIGSGIVVDWIGRSKCCPAQLSAVRCNSTVALKNKIARLA